MLKPKYRNYFRNFSQDTNTKLDMMPTPTDIRWLKWLEAAI